MTPSSFLLMGLMSLWQAIYLIMTFWRSIRFGLGLTVYMIAWLGLLIATGTSAVMAIAILTALEAASVAVIVQYAPKVKRVIALVFSSAAALLVVLSLIEPIAKHWRVVAGLLIICMLTAGGLAYLLSGFGKFGIGSLRSKIVAPSFAGSPSALLKYTYWSQRAIDSILSDNREPRARFSVV